MLRLAIRVCRREAELVLAELLALAPTGVEELDVSPEIVEYAVYGPPGELPALPDLRAAAGGALVEVSTSEVADDWSDRWRSFHRPLILPGQLTVRPPWEPAGDTPLDVVIDPGQAFGTGAHATTRLCLELLLHEPVKARPLIDLGCGSGVLAIVAGQLGYRPVSALDFDPLAVDATRQNVAANGVSVAVDRLDLRSDLLPAMGLETVLLANLLAPLLRTLAARVLDLPPESRPGTVLAGGLLSSEADACVAQFALAGLHGTERRVRDGWAAVRLDRTGSGSDSDVGAERVG